VVPPLLVRAAADLLRPLFLPPVVLAVLVTVVGTDAWLFFLHGVGPGVQDMLASPALLLVVAGLTIVAAGFHELGHAAACRYGGAEPGTIGVGLYLLWPAFYNDVTDSYRLSRGDGSEPTSAGSTSTWCSSWLSPPSTGSPGSSRCWW
jgi:putative peptide zinc metalloprotease protein